jgi:uncharacterized SAM-binding protein YcdF (DUF218 family)
MHTGRVVSCTTSPVWRWYQRGGLGLALGGGVLLLVAAAFARSGAIALLIIGAAWIAMAGGGLWFSRRIAYELRLDDEQVTFVFPGRELRVPARDVLAFERSRTDMPRMRPLRVLTTSHGAVMVNARLIGLFDFLLALRQANPNVAVPDL